MVAKSFGPALTLLLLCPAAALALGLGDIRLQSSLNAPLNAEIDLVGATSEDLSSLHASVATHDTFTRYGLDWPAFLGGISMRPEHTRDGRDVIKVTSRESITEPFVTLLVDVTWARGQLVREYTVLLDPPVYTPGASAAAAAPVAAPVVDNAAREGAISRAPARTAAAANAAASPEPTPAPAAAAPGAAAPAAAPAPAAPRTRARPAEGEPGTRVVQRGDTLSQIAGSLAGSGVRAPAAGWWLSTKPIRAPLKAT